MRDALVQIVLRLRDDVLKDREGNRSNTGIDNVYPGGTDLSAPPALPSVPPAAQLSYEQRADTGSGLSMLSSSSHYGYGSLSVRHYFILVLNFFVFGYAF